jgi:hypothetical protein
MVPARASTLFYYDCLYHVSDMLQQTVLLPPPRFALHSFVEWCFLLEFQNELQVEANSQMFQLWHGSMIINFSSNHLAISRTHCF